MSNQDKVWSGTYKDTTSGRKDDGDKPRLDLIPYDALIPVGRVLTSGAARYGDRNWENGIKTGRLFAACMRHLWAWWNGEDCDPDTGERHVFHAICCLLFIGAFLERGRTDLDDRPMLGLRKSEALPEDVSSPLRERVARQKPIVRRKAERKLKGVGGKKQS